MMIVFKTWERYKTETRDRVRKRYHDVYEGYFLFGLVPLYISRSRTRTS